ncbi:hypothetical protein NFI96_023059, partial [Prochilodus magdalenae]
MDNNVVAGGSSVVAVVSRQKQQLVYCRSSLRSTGVESGPSVVHKGTEGWEWSCHDTSLWNFEPESPHVTPIPLSARSPTPLATPTEITNSFPFRPRRTFSRSLLLDLLKDHPRFAQPPPCFLLNDFLESAHEWDQPEQLLRKAVLSHCNYKKLVDLFLSELHSGRQRDVANQILNLEDLPQVMHRIPQRQIMCEQAALVRRERQAQMVCVWHSADEPLSRIEQNSVELWMPDKSEAKHLKHDICPVNQVILSTFPVKHFQGFCRSSSPFQPAAECVMIALSELAVRECLEQCSTALSLKAHFIAQLPDLSPLAQSLLYLNLSFNNFSAFPVEVCELAQLEVLKLRDNPIEEIPAEIKKLLNLKTLVLSFCKITTLPSQLYHLPSLQHLDVSHNLISSLNSEIKNLRSLKYANFEGNQLEGLPVGILSVPLSELRVGGNYTHPLLLNINSVNSPPSLKHTAARILALIKPEQRYCSLPPDVHLTLS